MGKKGRAKGKHGVTEICRGFVMYGKPENWGVCKE